LAGGGGASVVTCTMSKRDSQSWCSGAYARARVAILKGGLPNGFGRSEGPRAWGPAVALRPRPLSIFRSWLSFGRCRPPRRSRRRGSRRQYEDQCSVEMRLYWSRDRRRSTKGASCLLFHLSGLKRCCGYDDRNGLRRERPRASVERENTTSQIVYNPNQKRAYAGNYQTFFSSSILGFYSISFCSALAWCISSVIR
jgi:hypothetical protein